jgi:adenylate cyclase
MNYYISRLKIFLITICIFQLKSNYAKEADTRIDSLHNVIHSAINDTVVVNSYRRLSKEFSQTESYDSSIKYLNEAISLSEKSGFKSGLSLAYIDKGKLSNDLGNYSEALKYFNLALKIFQEEDNKKDMANAYNFIANTYHVQGEFPEALKNQFAALKIREEIADSEGIAWSYNNIGIIYRLQGDQASALKNYFASLKILEKLGDKKTIATSYNNIGNIYSEQGNYNEALKNYFSSLRLRQQTGDKTAIGASYNNIGDIFCDLFEKDSLSNEVKVTYSENLIRSIPRNHWLDTANAYQSKALSINNELGDKYFSIFSLSGLGRINFLRKNYNTTINYYLKAYEFAKNFKALDLQQEIAKYLSDSYSKLNDFKNGMNWYVKFMEHKDSLFNEEKTRDLTRTQMKYEFDKKEEHAKSLQEKKDSLAKAETERQRKTRNILGAGLLLVFLFALIFFYQRNNIRKEKYRSDNLLLNILPAEIAAELKRTGSAKAKYFKEVTVMFADFVDFTIASEKISAEDLVNEINICFSAFDYILEKHSVEKIKTIGDAYLCAGGIPVHDPQQAEHILKAAIEIRDFMHERKKKKVALGETAFEIRIGIHTGPVVAGIVGVKKYAYDIWGDTVNIAARMEQNSEPGKINISNTTHDIVKDGFKFIYRGKIEAKNKGVLDMYFLV